MVILQGNIFYFSVSGLLRFIQSAMLTGRLVFTREDRTITLYFKRGKVQGVKGEKENYEPMEVLIEASLWIDGKFYFEHTEGGEEILTNVSMPSDQLILLLAKKEREIKELRKNLPSMDAVLVMNHSRPQGEIRLQPEEWNFLSKVDGKRTIRELAAADDLDELSVLTMIARMLKKGILRATELDINERMPLKQAEKIVKEKEIGRDLGRVFLAEEKIRLLEKLFMQYVGPMGGVIMDEALEALQLDRSRIPKEKFPKLLEKLSREIEREEEKRRFEEEISSIIEQG